MEVWSGIRKGGIAMFYNVIEVSLRYKVSRATIWRWVKEGTVKLAPGTTRWREEDLQAFEDKLK
jgi:predicted DNA-binding transcriptional regulator AlpA